MFTDNVVVTYLAFGSNIVRLWVLVGDKIIITIHHKVTTWLDVSFCLTNGSSSTKHAPLKSLHPAGVSGMKFWLCISIAFVHWTSSSRYYKYGHGQICPIVEPSLLNSRRQWQITSRMKQRGASNARCIITWMGSTHQRRNQNQWTEKLRPDLLHDRTTEGVTLPSSRCGSAGSSLQGPF